MTSISELQTGDAVIVIRRTLDAPRPLVFQMFTEPRHLAQFWGPKVTHVSVCKVDARVGGAFQVDMRGEDGTLYSCTGTYREIVPPEKIVYASTTADDNPCGGGLPPRSLVTISFEALGDKTKITIHAQLKSREAVEAAVAGGFSMGWNDSLDRLAELLVRR
jgi:uncharacterized protein YndB with AHSA1/START domain